MITEVSSEEFFRLATLRATSRKLFDKDNIQELSPLDRALICRGLLKIKHLVNVCEVTGRLNTYYLALTHEANLVLAADALQHVICLAKVGANKQALEHLCFLRPDELPELLVIENSMVRYNARRRLEEEYGR